MFSSHRVHVPSQESLSTPLVLINQSHHQPQRSNEPSGHESQCVIARPGPFAGLCAMPVLGHFCYRAAELAGELRGARSGVWS
jgi:hypothetical protein